jgi:hypothetical protein
MDGYEYPARPAASLGEAVVATVLPSESPPDGSPARFPGRDTPVRWSSGSVAVLRTLAASRRSRPEGIESSSRRSAIASRRPVPANGHRSFRSIRLAAAWSVSVRCGVYPSCPSRMVRDRENRILLHVAAQQGSGSHGHPPRSLGVNDWPTPGRNRRRVGLHRTHRKRSSFLPARRPTIRWPARRGCKLAFRGLSHARVRATSHPVLPGW